MSKFAKTPGWTEAHHWTGDHVELLSWIAKVNAADGYWISVAGGANIATRASLRTPRGDLSVHIGDYIIRERDASLSVCSQELFQMTHEKPGRGPLRVV